MAVVCCAECGWSRSIGIASSCDLENWEVIGQILPTQACEQNGICAPGAVVLNEKVHLFYQTYGNGALDAICHAVSEDGVHFKRVSNQPLLSNGAPGSWNASVSGHPYVFENDGDTWLFYQGSPDNGETWYISKAKIVFQQGQPSLVEE